MRTVRRVLLVCAAAVGLAGATAGASGVPLEAWPVPALLLLAVLALAGDRVTPEAPSREAAGVRS